MPTSAPIPFITHIRRTGHAVRGVTLDFIADDGATVARTLLTPAALDALILDLITDQADIRAAASNVCPFRRHPSLSTLMRDLRQPAHPEQAVSLSNRAPKGVPAGDAA